MDSRIRLTIHCLVYNHEKYLRKCLEGIVNQRTSFKFEALVHDDVSTDGSAKIIKEFADKYPEIIKPIIQHQNLYSKGGFSVVSKFLTEKSTGDYIALCDGDDYWTDFNKLQEQFDYLESHKDCGLVRTDEDRLFDETGKIIEKSLSTTVYKNNKDTFEDYLLNGWYAGPSTWMYRKDLMIWPNLDPKKYMLDDICMILQFSLTSKIHYIDKSTTMYRVHIGSVSHKEDVRDRINLFNKVKNIRYYYARQKSMGFRLRLWCKLFFIRWRSFKFDFKCYPEWIVTGLKDFFRIVLNKDF